MLQYNYMTAKLQKTFINPKAKWRKKKYDRPPPRTVVLNNEIPDYSLCSTANTTLKRLALSVVIALKL